MFIAQIALLVTLAVLIAIFVHDFVHDIAEDERMYRIYTEQCVQNVEDALRNAEPEAPDYLDCEVEALKDAIADLEAENAALRRRCYQFHKSRNAKEGKH